mgnify:CR=1 FL=1
MMRISVIVPAHNCENTIVKCIESIIKQDYKDLEILIVENNSNDKTYLLCCDLEKKYRQVKLLQNKEVGVSAARNKGIDFATGDIITFCDSDDYMEYGILEKVSSKLQGNVGIVVVGFKIVDTFGNVREKCLIGQNENWTTEDFIVHTLEDQLVMGSCWNRYYRADLIRNIRFDTSLTMLEDGYFNVCFASNNHDVICMYLNDIGYNYVIGSTNASHNPDNKFDNTKYRFFKAIDLMEANCTLTQREKKACKVSRGRLSSRAQLITKSQRKNSEIQKLRWKNLKKTFWKYAPNYFLCPFVTFKEKVKGIIKYSIQ